MLADYLRTGSDPRLPSLLLFIAGDALAHEDHLLRSSGRLQLWRGPAVRSMQATLELYTELLLAACSDDGSDHSNGHAGYGNGGAVAAGAAAAADGRRQLLAGCLGALLVAGDSVSFVAAFARMLYTKGAAAADVSQGGLNAAQLDGARATAWCYLQTLLRFAARHLGGAGGGSPAVPGALALPGTPLAAAATRQAPGTPTSAIIGTPLTQASPSNIFIQTATPGRPANGAAVNGALDGGPPGLQQLLPPAMALIDVPSGPVWQQLNQAGAATPVCSPQPTGRSHAGTVGHPAPLLGALGFLRAAFEAPNSIQHLPSAGSVDAYIGYLLKHVVASLLQLPLGDAHRGPHQAQLQQQLAASLELCKGHLQVRRAALLRPQSWKQNSRCNARKCCSMRACVRCPCLRLLN